MSEGNGALRAVNEAALMRLFGSTDDNTLTFEIGSLAEANFLLSRHHYLGPIHKARLVVVGLVGTRVVTAQVWNAPTARHLPLDGTWLELSRWCLIPEAGENAGSRGHRASVRLIRDHLPSVTTLVSYSDPGHGHSGALYRACNWVWAPTLHRLKPPPSGNGDWGTGIQHVKDRWLFQVKRDAAVAQLIASCKAEATRRGVFQVGGNCG